MGKVEFELLNYSGQVRYLRFVLRGLLNNIDDLVEEDVTFIGVALEPLIDELDENDFFGTEGIRID